MALTVQYVVSRVREVLNDRDGDRYLDSEIFAYIGEAYQIARRVRPDLFIYRFAQPIVAPTALSDTLLVPDIYADAVSHYAAGRSELRDDEFAVDGRSMTLAGKFESILMRGL